MSAPAVTSPAPVRPATGVPLRRTLRRRFAAGLAMLVIAGGAGIAGVVLVTARFDNVVTRFEPLARANAAALQALTNAETGVRGYALEGQTQFLQPYYAGKKAFPAAIDEAFHYAVAGDRGRLGVERRVGDTWLERYAEPIVDSQGRLNHSLADAAKQQFDRFRAANAAVAASITRQTAGARDNADNARTWVLVVVALLTLAGLGVALATRRRLLVELAAPLEELAGTLGLLTGGDLAARTAPKGAAEMIAVGAALNELGAQIQRLAAIDRRRHEMSVLSASLGEAVREHLDLTTTLEAAVAAIGTALTVDRVVVRLAEDGRVGDVAAAWIRPGAAHPDSFEQPESVVGVLQELADHRQTVAAGDIGDGTVAVEPSIVEHLLAIGFVAGVVCPILAGGDLLGLLILVQGERRHWAADEVDVIEATVAQLGRALHHAQLFSKEQELVAQLQDLDKTKSEFLSTVSHELRTPLTSINGYIEMLTDGDAGDINDEQRSMLAVVDRNATRLRSLIDDLLTLSRIESGAYRLDVAPFDLAEVVRAVALAVEPLAQEKQLTMETSCEHDLGPFRGDAGQIERVLLNLLSNAVKFTLTGGTVRLAAVRELAEVLITVSDSGIGIPAEEQNQLFSRFFRASNASARAVPGTGLGLTIVQGIVERHGGSIAVESTVDVGTTIVVRLPSDRRARPRPSTALA